MTGYFSKFHILLLCTDLVFPTLAARVPYRIGEVNFSLIRDWRDSDNIRLFASSVSDPEKRSRTITADDLLLIMTPSGITKSEGPMLNVASLGGLVRWR